jgi:hypothetical protein
MYAKSETEFYLKVANISFTFSKPVSGKSETMVIHQSGQDLTATRYKKRVLTEAEAREYVGDYYSAELGVIYTITEMGGKLRIRHPRAEYDLEPGSDDTMAAPFPISTLNFTRGADKRITGFKIDAGRVMGVRFLRTVLPPVGG